MKTNIKATGIALTEALSNHIDEKTAHISKFLDAHDETIFCNVEIGLVNKHHHSGDIFRAEINLRTASGKYRAVSEKADLYVAINDAKDSLVSEIDAQKKKERTLFRHGAKKIKNIIQGFRK